MIFKSKYKKLLEEYNELQERYNSLYDVTEKVVMDKNRIFVFPDFCIMGKEAYDNLNSYNSEIESLKEKISILEKEKSDEILKRIQATNYIEEINKNGSK